MGICCAWILTICVKDHFLASGEDATYLLACVVSSMYAWCVSYSEASHTKAFNSPDGAGTDWLELVVYLLSKGADPNTRLLPPTSAFKVYDFEQDGQCVGIARGQHGR